MKEKFIQESSKNFKARIKQQREYERKKNKHRSNENIFSDIEDVFYQKEKQWEKM